MGLAIKLSLDVTFLPISHKVSELTPLFIHGVSKYTVQNVEGGRRQKAETPSVEIEIDCK